jgi:hypothetical protein
MIHVQAIKSTQAAIQDPRRVTEDNTLISVYLLSIFEVRYIAYETKAAALTFCIADILGTSYGNGFVETACRGQRRGSPAPGTVTNTDKNRRFSV